MARDRKRAKARQRRQEPSPPKKRRPQRGADETGLPAGGEPTGLERDLDGIDTPGFESPYVDEARLAEAGADVPEPGEGLDEDDLELTDEEMDQYMHAPEDIEGDLVPTGAAERANLDPAVAEEHVSGATVRTERKQRGRVGTFLGHVVDELRRVQWPNRRQVGQGTAVTLGFVVLAGGYLGLMDAIWKPVIEAIL